jgi:hypothetical protein
MALRQLLIAYLDAVFQHIDVQVTKTAINAAFIVVSK